LSFQHVRLKTVPINERANAETVPKSDRRQNLGERGMKVPNAEQAIVEIAKRAITHWTQPTKRANTKRVFLPPRWKLPRATLIG
jgi:hypothetical protein